MFGTAGGLVGGAHARDGDDAGEDDDDDVEAEWDAEEDTEELVELDDAVVNQWAAAFSNRYD